MDGAAILKDGVMMTIEEILAELNTRPGYEWKTFEEWKLVLNAMGLSVKDEHPEDIWNAAREMKEEGKQ